MLKFIDARCRLGVPAVQKEGTPYQTDEILEVMDRCHIAQAIAYTATDGTDPHQDNRELLRLTEGNPRFLRQWQAMPSVLGDFPQPEALIAEMKANGVTSLRLSPKTCGFSLAPFCIGKLMDAVAECRIPIFLDMETDVDPKTMYTLCQTYPNVNFVFCKPAYGWNRVIAGVAETCPNFHVGAGNYLVHGGIKLFCQDYSAEKLIFDTGLPESCATSAVPLICFADISQEEKELIAHGNIEHLLGEVRL